MYINKLLVNGIALTSGTTEKENNFQENTVETTLNSNIENNGKSIFNIT